MAAAPEIEALGDNSVGDDWTGDIVMSEK